MTWVFSHRKSRFWVIKIYVKIDLIRSRVTYQTFTTRPGSSAKCIFSDFFFLIFLSVSVFVLVSLSLFHTQTCRYFTVVGVEWERKVLVHLNHVCMWNWDLVCSVPQMGNRHSLVSLIVSAFSLPVFSLPLELQCLWKGFLYSPCLEW